MKFTTIHLDVEDAVPFNIAYLTRATSSYNDKPLKKGPLRLSGVHLNVSKTGDLLSIHPVITNTLMNARRNEKGLKRPRLICHPHGSTTRGREFLGTKYAFRIHNEIAPRESRLLSLHDTIPLNVPWYFFSTIMTDEYVIPVHMLLKKAGTQWSLHPVYPCLSLKTKTPHLG